ncbi:hypothetical protein BH11PLA2_BH11PLA2_20710 [soil metagenome]
MTPPTFESALAELETVLRELESEATSLDDALARYENGVKLLRHCYGQLKNAELKIQQLTGTADDGTPLLSPFEHTAAVKKKKASAEA